MDFLEYLAQKVLLNKLNNRENVMEGEEDPNMLPTSEDSLLPEEENFQPIKTRADILGKQIEEKKQKTPLQQAWGMAVGSALSSL